MYVSRLPFLFGVCGTAREKSESDDVYAIYTIIIYYCRIKVNKRKSLWITEEYRGIESPRIYEIEDRRKIFEIESLKKQ